MYYHSDLLEKADIEGAEYRERFHYSQKSGLKQVFSYIGSIIGIMVDVMRERPDVVHIQWFKLWLIDYTLVLLLRMMGIRTIFTAHNVLPHHPKWGDRLCYRLYYRAVDAIIVHTEDTRRQLLSLFGLEADKVNVIRHGVLPSFEDAEAVAERTRQLRQELGVGQRVVFASMGFQNYYKGADLIVDSWINTPALRDNPDVLLLMVGKVENADLTRLYQCPNVFVLNEKVSNVDFEAYMQLVSVMLLPYREISQSGVLLTSLQRGVPVLVSSAGGLTEPLQIAKVGWEMGEATVTNLQRSLLALFSAPDRIENVRRDTAAFDAVRRAYSWETIGQQTRHLYAAKD